MTFTDDQALGETFHWIGRSKRLTEEGSRRPGRIIVVVQLLSHVQLFCDPMDYTFCVCRISQEMMLEWVVISFSRGSSWSRDWTHISCIGRQILYHSATREALGGESEGVKRYSALRRISIDWSCLESVIIEAWRKKNSSLKRILG